MCGKHVVYFTQQEKAVSMYLSGGKLLLSIKKRRSSSPTRSFLLQPLIVGFLAQARFIFQRMLFYIFCLSVCLSASCFALYFWFVCAIRGQMGKRTHTIDCMFFCCFSQQSNFLSFTNELVGFCNFNQRSFNFLFQSSRLRPFAQQ